MTTSSCILTITHSLSLSRHIYFASAFIMLCRRRQNVSPATNLSSLFIAYSDWSVAVPTTWRHSLRSFAFRPAVWTPKFIGLTSSAITCSKVKLGLPGGRFQDRGGFCIAAQTARRWSSVDCTRAMWPKKRNLLARTVSETGRHCVACLIYY